MLDVGAHAPLRWGHEVPERCRLARVGTAVLDPGSLPSGPLLVGRVADHDEDRLALLDVVRLAAGPGHRLVVDAERLVLDERVVQRVGDVGAKARRGSGVEPELGEFGEHSELGHREGTELQLESDDAPDDRGQRTGDGTLAEVVGKSVGDQPDGREQEGSRSHRGVDQRHDVLGEPAREVEPTADCLVDQPGHRLDDLRWRVVRAGPLAQVRVVLPEETFVEVEPHLRVALGHGRPFDHRQHPCQRRHRGSECVRRHRVVGEDAERTSDQRVRGAELLRGGVDAAMEVDLPRPGEQEGSSLDQVGLARRGELTGGRSFR